MQQPSPYHLDYAKLDWHDGDIPISREFEDIYFQKQQGLAETDYVFLQHNQLAQRWSELSNNDDTHRHFTIAETGFGTGLNFLASWQLWQQTAPKNWHLHFISTEKHPLQREDLIRSLRAWPSLQHLSQALIEQYPPLLPGHHYLNFANDHVHLHLLLGDAIESFEQLKSSNHPDFNHCTPHKVDAWFLDGFAPARNPSLWNEKLYRVMAELSHTETTLATFTAVSAVRRGLIEQGFTIEKAPGFNKRNMLYGRFQQAPKENTAAEHKHYPKGIKAPWYIPSNSHQDDDHSSQRSTHIPKQAPKHVAIIGGGIAGASSAYALAKRGWKVTIIEKQNQLAQAASGNPQGMLFTKISAQISTLSHFNLSSYLYALRFYQQLLTQQILPAEKIAFCGMLQLASTNKEKKMYEALKNVFSEHPELVRFVDAQEASDLSGVALQHAGWFFPGSGWLSPPQLCQSLTQHPNITILTHQTIERLHYAESQDTDAHWQLYNHSNSQTPLLDADIVIIANSQDATRFAQTKHLPIKPIRGQTTTVKSEGPVHGLKTVICHTGYITPAIDNHHNLGATFDPSDSNTDVRESDHQRNLDNLTQCIPSLNQHFHIKEGRAGLRCTAPDYLPIVGPVYQHQTFIEDYRALAENAHYKIDTAGSYYPNLYINIGHGSRGLTSTPLCSELLAAQICNHPPPLPRELIQALNPARFALRGIIRSKG
jgi:tRNA 5-methylaminomethyl-2-thiouridine biosynthesis bifunctional protein